MEVTLVRTTGLRPSVKDAQLKDNLEPTPLISEVDRGRIEVKHLNNDSLYKLTKEPPPYSILPYLGSPPGILLHPTLPTL